MPRKGSFARCVSEVSARGGVSDPRAVCAASKIRAGEDLAAARARARHKNPADAAAEAYELFHGHPPETEIVFESVEHIHEFYTGIGDLIELVIVPDGDSKGVLLQGFKGAQLTANEGALLKPIHLKERLTQLFIVGGDQSLDPQTLKLFHVDPKNLHEQELLGKCVDITYFTDKSHLGRDGGVADYVHAFSEGKPRKLRILKSPTATYHVVNEMIGLWGGEYTIEPEGITN